MVDVDQEQLFRNIYRRLLTDGEYSAPRGLEIIEIENFRVAFPPYVRFINFKSRKLNLEYIKREFLWYLKADKYDTSIAEHASLWKSLINKDGSINSNYGQYLFRLPQFANVIDTLAIDKDSRRAAMTILQPQHLLSDTKDVPCTYCINFHIRNNKLNMMVHMRSQDAVYGLGNDLPTFSFIHEMMHVCLRDLKYIDLEIGSYMHTVDSFHAYKKHYDMIRSIALSNDDTFTEIFCPYMQDKKEIINLITYRLDKNKKFTSWLLDYV